MNNDQINPRSAIYEQSFQGKDWYKCPYCDEHFVLCDIVFERGFDRCYLLENGSNKKIYLHKKCGNYISI